MRTPVLFHARSVLAAGTVLFLLTTGISCDSGARGEVSTPRPICDGTPGLKFVSHELPTDRVAQGELLYFDFWGLIAVDGNCHFWIQDAGTLERFPAIRTGVLDEKLERRLAQDLLYSRLGELSKKSLPSIGLADAGALALSNGVDVALCWGLCGDPSNPPEIRRLHDNHRKYLEELFRIGQPVDGQVRIIVLDMRELVFEGNGSRWSEWPLNRDPEKIALSARDNRYNRVGYSTKIELPSETAPLRMLREKTGPYGFMVRRKESGPGLAEFQVFVRDTVPFENERGLIELQWRKKP